MANPAATIAVLVTASTPESTQAVYAGDAGTGAVKGARDGAAAGTGATVALFLTSPLDFVLLANPLNIVLLPAAALGGVVAGGLWGAFQATTPQRAEEIAQAIATRLADAKPSEAAAQAFASALAKTGAWRGVLLRAGDAPDGYAGLSAQGFGAAVEVRARRVAFTPVRGEDPYLALIVTTEARLVELPGGTVAASRHATYQSPMRQWTHWTADHGALLRAEIDRANAVVGDRLVASLLLGAEWSHVPTFRTAACGLQTLAPVASAWTSVIAGVSGSAYASVTSRAPMLAWEPFPPAKWVESNPVLRSARDVAYDVRIWKAVELSVGDLVYERFGLSDPNHRVEQELAPGTDYLWSVRARYALDGRPLATRWSATLGPRFTPSHDLVAAAAAPRIDAGVSVPSQCAHGDADRWTPCKCLDFIPMENHAKFTTP